MKQVIGYIVIILTFPILFFVLQAINTEVHSAELFDDKVTESIELSHPPSDLPIILKDQNGTIFSEEYVEWRDPLLLADIPIFVQQIFLESEDTGFYEHRGYDVAAITRAFIANASTENLSQGGSTITQQLVRMRFLSTDKTYERKVIELLYAAELEKRIDKNKILEMYLNEMYFGNQVYGIGAAATYYFNRPLAELNKAEIAFISAIPNNPSLYNPINYFERTKKRQELLLNVLVKNGVLPNDEALILKDLTIDLDIKEKMNQFPAYTTYVFSELQELIGETEGFLKKIEETNTDDSKRLLTSQLKKRTKEVMSSGIVIETALESKKQLLDEATVTKLLEPEGLQAGAVVIDNKTRKIVSLYGGRDYKKADFNRVFQAVRQPGSAIKPLLVYGPLFESNPNAAKMTINSGNLCIGSYCPTNFGGYVYGNVSIKEAFRNSHNTAAVRVLQQVGIDEAFSYLEPFAFKSITSKDKIYPAALGGLTKGVTPLELAGAYTGFIDGKFVPARAIQTVKDKDGHLLYEWNEERVNVWSPSTTAIVRNLMEDVVVNGTGRGITYTTSYTGAKTGTSNQDKDLWTAGMNDQYTTAVWIGHDQPKPMPGVSNRKIHLQVFSALLQK
ncbi:transglycosylase domain-containing protein [Sporosarcina sp. CAU 1771]